MISLQKLGSVGAKNCLQCHGPSVRAKKLSLFVKHMSTVILRSASFQGVFSLMPFNWLRCRSKLGGTIDAPSQVVGEALEVRTDRCFGHRPLSDQVVGSSVPSGGRVVDLKECVGHHRREVEGIESAMIEKRHRGHV